MKKQEVLKQFSFYRESEAHFQQELVESGTLVRLSAGDIYFQEGSPIRQFAMVGAGRLRVYKVSETGREITLYHVQAGECCLLNIACLMTDRKSPATARAEEAVTALVYPGAAFRGWVGRSAALRDYVFEILATRVAGIMALIEEVSFQRMDRRLAEFLLDRFNRTDPERPLLQMTHEQVAGELGTAREVVSRLLKDFEHLGAVELSRGRISLRDRSALNQLIAAG